MYKISVPVVNSTVKRSDRERLLKEIKRFDTKRIFLAIGVYELDETKRKKALKELKDNCAFFKEQGYEVGTWLWTFWVKNNTEFRNMRSIDGMEIAEFMCPTDEKFIKFATDYISDVAKCGVDLIQYDDDFRYGFLYGTHACLCDKHIEIINSITGENSTREEIYNSIVSGKKNKIRDAYLKANGDAFRNFAYEIRKAVNKVDPTIRVGACACLSSWDVDGTNAYELATILAGDTKPFVRLIGAPYWAVNKSWGNCLQDAIELERMESAWTRQGDIEIMAEGDSWPRPRINCPASYLEGFDTAIRASGCTDGILKYGIDYTSNADYETGYAKFHERNKGIYENIDKVFSGKNSCGVRVYEFMNKVSDMVMPTKVNEQVDIGDLFFSKAARVLACNSIPTVYEGSGVCGIVFDENARNLPLSALENGLILDIAAAEILTERGIDVGLEEIGAVANASVKEEHFLNDNNHILINGANIYDIKINKNAEILSDMKTDDKNVPISYRYQNASGHRFLILNINTRNNKSSMLKHYARGRQIAENIPWLSGQTLPAYVYGHPSLYLQSKKNENAMAVGLWNFYADTAITPVVELDREYTNINFINCSGELLGDKVYLSDIQPFGFAGFEVML